MTLLKKVLSPALTIVLLMAKLIPVSAQFAYKPSIRVTFGKVSFDLYCKTGTFGFGQQFYPANFYNQTFYDIHVKGEYVATLVCGNEAVSKLDFTCKKYSSLIHVDVNDANFPYVMPKGFGTDFSGLVGIADEKLCTGNDVVVQNWIDGGKTKTKDRITRLSIRKLKLFAIQDDGSEVPITDEGVMISAPPAAKSNNPQGTAGNQSNTTGNSSKQPPNAGAGVSAGAATKTATQPQNTAPNQQQQAYQQQANNYLNAASHSSDAIQQSMNMGLAGINATAAGNTAQAAQIRQMQQQQTAANNAAIAQGVNDLGNTVVNLFAANSERKAEAERQKREEQAAYELETRQREEAARQYNEKMRLEAERARQVEIANQHNMDQQALGPYITRRKLSEIPDNSKEIYYVTYERTHDANSNVKIKTYAVAKYSDGTWMMISEIMKKVNFDDVFNDYNTKLFVGFFTSKKDALQLIENMKTYFQGRVTADTSFLALNQPANTATKKDDFWNQ